MQVNLDRKHLGFLFIFCLCLVVVMPTLFSQLRLTFFAPFLIIVCYQKRLTTCLWLALGCGLFLDLLSSHHRLGLYALDYCATIILLYPQRRNFFADSLSTLPIMTFLFAFISTLIMAVLLYSIESINVFSLPWILTDLVLFPGLDSLYAFSCFILPAILLGKPRMKGKDYFQ